MDTHTLIGELSATDFGAGELSASAYGAGDLSASTCGAGVLSVTPIGAVEKLLSITYCLRKSPMPLLPVAYSVFIFTDYSLRGSITCM